MKELDPDWEASRFHHVLFQRFVVDAMQNSLRSPANQDDVSLQGCMICRDRSSTQVEKLFVYVNLAAGQARYTGTPHLELHCRQLYLLIRATA